MSRRMDPAGGNEEDVVGISGFGMFGAPSLPGSGISSYRDPTDLGALQPDLLHLERSFDADLLACIQSRPPFGGWIIL